MILIFILIILGICEIIWTPRISIISGIDKIKIFVLWYNTGNNKISKGYIKRSYIKLFTL